MPSLSERADRISDHFIGIKTAASVVGLEDHRRMLRDNAKRVQDASRLQMRALGQKDMESQSAEEMGDITVTGDIYQQNLPDKPKSEQKRVWPMLLATALATAGIGGPLGVIAAKMLAEPKTPTTGEDKDVDTKYELEIVQ